MPKISVIVPVYNAEGTLSKCIDSVLTQSFQDFELILVDDGSNDASGTICDEYSTRDERIKVFHKTNGGASSARNLGIDNASGEWVTFCDSDDWVDSDWLSIFIANMCGCEIICQGIRYDYSILEQTFPPVEIVFDYIGDACRCLELLYENKCIGYTVNKCFRTDVLKRYNLRFDIRYNYKEDEEFVLRYMTCISSAISLPLVSYNYILPDFVNKYKFPREELNLYESCFRSVKCMFKNNVNTTLLYYLDLYTITLLTSFVDKPCIRDVWKYRKNVGKYVLYTRLFFLTKWTLYLDFTGLFSCLILLAHSMMRKLRCEILIEA